MLKLLNRNLRLLYSRLRWPIRRRSKSKVVIRRFGKPGSKLKQRNQSEPTSDHKLAGSATVHPAAENSVRIATFNAALFSMAPAVPATVPASFRAKSLNADRPKSILKQSPLHPIASRQERFAKSKLRVSINLPDNEISKLRSRRLSFSEVESAPGRAPASSRTVLDVLRELDADIVALQDVKAEEEKEMKPLSDLAAALGMRFVFAESWAPEYGNAILSKWPIKRSKVQKIFDDSDFRNVLKATIEIPKIGEINFHSTHLDHLDENWRMKQINAIIQSNNEPHILVGSLNSLDETDYSQERWTDIVKYYEEMGKPTPKVEVIKHLKSKLYTDAKDVAGECESVVMIAKGQSVQGTCKYGTRVDYIMASPNSTYNFVPNSYSVFSSKGTSDHHIVKVDITKVDNTIASQLNKNRNRKKWNSKPKVIRMSASSPTAKGIWET